MNWQRHISIMILAFLLAAMPAGCQKSVKSDASESAPPTDATRAENPEQPKTTGDTTEHRGLLTRGAPKPDPTKHALLIGVGDYPKETHIPDLVTTYDLELMQKALAHHGFPKENVEDLQDEEATAEGIRKAFDKLVQRVSAGDVVVVYYAGHGQQITDDDSPVEELDGYDEALLAWGAPGIPEDGYDGSKHVRDDEIGEFLGDLRHKLGSEGSVMLAFDSCYSGTATRAPANLQGRTRGLTKPIGKPATGKRSPNAGQEMSGLAESLKTRAGGDNFATLAFISAARHDQKAWQIPEDGKQVGALSIALSEALLRAGPNTTYRTLFHQVQSGVAKRPAPQTPQLEGDADALVFGGKAEERRNVFAVTGVNEREVVVGGGSLVGLLPGTKLAFYKAGADLSSAKPIARGSVTKADATTARVTMADEAKAKAVAKSLALVEAYGLGDMKITLAVDKKVRAANKKLIERLGKLPYVEIVKQGGNLVLFDEKGKLVLTKTGDDAALAGPIEAGDDVFEEVAKGVQLYARRKLLLDVELEHPEIAVSLEVQPVKHEIKEGVLVKSTALPAATNLTAGGEYIFRPKDGYKLVVKNQSKKKVYLNVLLISSDGTIQQIFPHPGSSSSAAELPPERKEYVLPVPLAASEPFGVDVFKVFATEKPVDFSPVIRTRGKTRSAGTPSPLEQVMARAMLLDGEPQNAAKAYKTRGESQRPVASGTGATASVQVRVAPPEEANALLTAPDRE